MPQPAPSRPPSPVTTRVVADLHRPAVLGAIDGLITSFVIVASGFAGRVAKDAVLLIGIASLLADALSMSASEYLSTRAEDVPRHVSATQAVVCGVAFVGAGLFPIVGYAAPSERSWEAAAATTLFTTGIVAVGYARSRGGLRGMLEVTLVGWVAGAVAICVGILGTLVR